MPSESRFIPDQRIFTLELSEDERGSTREYLQIERLPDLGRPDDPAGEGLEPERFRSHWRESPSRFELLGDRSRKRVCITVGAGCGKSIAIEQLAVVRESLDPGHLVILVHFSDLPDTIKDYPNFLVDQFHAPFDELSEHELESLPTSESPEAHIRSLLRTGQCTLAIDGLDEVNVKSGKKKAKALRTFLSRYPEVGCCVASRPYAVEQSYWRELFSTSGKDTDIGSMWDFWLVGSFTQEQIEEFLGRERYAELQRLQADIEFTPRVLETFRTLRREVLAEVRSVADVFWHSIDQSLRIDRKKNGQLPNTDLTHDEILDFLSACAVTLVMWQHDPMSDGDQKGNRVQQGQDPVRRVEKSDLIKFKKLVFNRMRRIYGKRFSVDRKWGSLQELCLSYIEFQFFLQDATGFSWRNNTERDFFAALWMVRSSSPEEREWFATRQSKVYAYPKESSQIPELNEAWRFIAGMPDGGMINRDDGEDRLGRWTHLIHSVYEPNHVRYRATELMYRSWPNLLIRAGLLEKPSWDEEDLLVATHQAQTKFGGNAYQPSTTPPCNDKEKSLAVVESFLRQYPTLRDGGGEPAKIIAEDLKFCHCESYAGMQVRVGHASEDDNPERDETLPRAFSMCAYPVTNRLYELFDANHASRFSNYNKYSPEERCPAIYANWTDAMMISIWCHGYLPSEWEWEYACRAKRCNQGGSNAIYYWGDDEALLMKHAWVYQNSKGQTHPVGSHPAGTDPKNAFGLYDTLGNVREWTRSCYTTDRSRRVVRGGSFYGFAFGARCSFRDYIDPSDTGSYDGVRVSRAR